MGLILLEAFLALCIFIAIVWWTMFSGRTKGELRQAQPPSEPSQKEASEQALGHAVSEMAAKETSKVQPAPDDTRR
jgi:hypothetical protein